MALHHDNITVGTTPTPILTLPNGVGYVAVQIYNNDSNAIYVGDSAVTATNPTVGLRIGTTASLQLWMHGNESVYAVSAAGTASGAVTVVYSA